MRATADQSPHRTGLPFSHATKPFFQGPDRTALHLNQEIGRYDPALDWFTQVNPAGVRLLSYPWGENFLSDPDPSPRSLP